jgi:lipopolysaccharide export system protein LptC
MTGILRTFWDRLSIYLPVILMGLFALGTWWLVRSAPEFLAPDAPRALRHEPDYFMRKFSLKTFDAAGRLKSEVFGAEAHHFPDTDTLEIDQVRIRSFDDSGRLTVATASRALSNADGSEVQLLGNAQVVREATPSASGVALPRLEFRGEFLHAFVKAERITSHKPVTLLRGTDQFTAQSMDYDHRTQVLDLRGQVRGVLLPRSAR